MFSPNHPCRLTAAILKDLRARIRKFERHAPGVNNEDSPPPLPFGVGAIDTALPWGGLPRACLHEIVGGDGLGAATGFCAALLTRFAGDDGVALWCRRERDLYGPGLTAFGLDPERLIVVCGRTTTDVLWAMEEGLRSGGPAVVLGETGTITPTAARRLQLAAEASGVTALLLRSASKMTPSLAVTRWHISAMPSKTLGNAVGTSWKVAMLRCRGAKPQSWFLEWRNEKTNGFSLVSDLCHRPSEPPSSQISRLAS